MGHGGKAGPAGEVHHVTCCKCTKFHSNPSTPSRGFPVPLSTPAIFPGLFRRGSRELLGHSFYRLPGPYLPFAGLFRRGPRDPSTSIASAAVLGEKDRKGPGKTVREGEAY